MLSINYKAPFSLKKINQFKFKMNNYKNCLKIESTFPEDDLLVPQKGEISLEINENNGILN